MKNMIITLFVSCLFANTTSFAAKILLKDGNQFPSGDIIAIQDRLVIVKTEFGNLTAEFDKIDTILFDEKASPTKPGIQFKNGDVITGELDTLKDNVLTIKMKYGLYVIRDMSGITSVNFAKSANQIDDNQEGTLHGLFSLNKDEHIYGDLLAIEDGVMVVNTRYGTLNIKVDDAEKIQFAATPKLSNGKRSMILLKNNDHVQGKPISLKNGELHIQTAFGEMIITKTNILANVFLGENLKTTNAMDENIPNSSQSEEINFDFAQYKEWDVVPALGKGNIVVKTSEGLALTSDSDDDLTYTTITIQEFLFTNAIEILIRAQIDFWVSEKNITLFNENNQASVIVKLKENYIIIGNTSKSAYDRWDHSKVNTLKIVFSNNVARLLINEEFCGSQEASSNTLTKITITGISHHSHLYAFSIKPLER